jgi:hypothetical protein
MGPDPEDDKIDDDRQRGFQKVKMTTVPTRLSRGAQTQCKDLSVCQFSNKQKHPEDFTESELFDGSRRDHPARQEVWMTWT